MPRLSLPAAFRLPRAEHLQPHFVVLDVQFDKALQADLKRFPGFSWGLADTKSWYVPRELQSHAADVIASHGYERPDVLSLGVWPGLGKMISHTDHHPWQQQGWEMIRDLGYGFLMFSPGLGKTAPAARAISGQPTIWVCPAMSRWSIAREIQRVTPGVRLQVLEPGAMSLDPGQDIIVCSYQGLEAVIASYFVPRWLVIDEAHNIKNKKTDRSVWVREITTKHKPQIIELSGTPIPNRPHDLWNPLDIMCPRRFGTEWQFQERYSKIGHNGWGRTIGGLNTATADELNARLRAISIRATEEDAQGYLPPINFYVEWGRPRKDWSHLEDDAYLQASASEKTDWGVQVGAEEIDQGRSPAIVTWHRSAAEKISKALGIECVHGALPATKRDAKLQEIARKGKPFVATMASIAEGLNQLANYQHVIIVELYYKWSLLIQMMKRFHRLNTRNVVSYRALAIPETIDERIIATLVEKTNDVNRLIGAGSIENAVSGIVNDIDMSSILEGWVPESE